jgi:hypothetical protein
LSKEFGVALVKATNNGTVMDHDFPEAFLHACFPLFGL